MKPTCPALFAVAFVLAGCGNVPIAPPAVTDARTPALARAHQSRQFETTDRERVLRAVLATLHQLGFVIEKADAAIGIVSATKLDGYSLRTTVTVQRSGERHLLVRANAQYFQRTEMNVSRALDDPAAYADFFTALAKALSLEALPAS